MQFNNSFYCFRAVISPCSRSRVNIPFRVGKGDDFLENKFVEEAGKQGLAGLAGHRYKWIYLIIKSLILFVFHSFI